MIKARAIFVSLIATLLISGCTVGPNYRRPDVPMTDRFKSTTQPAAETELRQDWWEMFHDPALTDLEVQALAANNDLRAGMSRVEQARAAAGVTKAGFYPTVTFDPSVAWATGQGSGGISTSVLLPIDISYEFDLWGRVRRSFEAAKAQTQAAIDDFGVVRLTLTTDLATQYYNVRSLDAQIEITERNVDAYRQQLDYLHSQQKAGFATPLEVVQVQTLLDSTTASEWDTRRQRENAVHAIAILLGKPPADFSLAPNPIEPILPVIPAGIPADLLRHRPDIAEAEQNLIAANAQVGVAIAEFYPTVTLGAAAGYRDDDASGVVSSRNRFGSIGPAASIPIFEGGALKANQHLAQAQYDELVSNYRSTLLGAFRDVEDALTNIEFQSHQAEVQKQAVAGAREYLRLTEIQRKQGLLNPLQVLDADRTLLSNELVAAQVLNARIASTILLIKAIGGGWSETLPPTTAPTTRPAMQRLTTGSGGG